MSEMLSILYTRGFFFFALFWGTFVVKQQHNWKHCVHLMLLITSIVGIHIGNVIIGFPCGERTAGRREVGERLRKSHCLGYSL